MSLKILTGAFLIAAATLPATAATTIAGAYTRVSTAETITAAFTAPAGTSSVRQYTGSVEVLVSGTGFSLGSAINDAFYFAPSGTDTGAYYKLAIGTSAQPLAPFDTTRNASRLINFIDGVGAVSFGTAPAYSPTNSYRFVADIGGLSSLLSFGVLDGNFGDNGGQYNVTLWQLAPGVSAVPESSTWLMMIVGFGAAGAVMRRRKSAGVSIA